MKKGQYESRWPREVASRFGHPISTSLQQNAEDQNGYYARCKRSMVLSAWTAGSPLADIERNHTANPYQGKIGSGDVRRFTDATRFHLRSAYDIATLLLVENGPDDSEIETLLKCLETGVPADLHGLLEVSSSLGRGECLALGAVGIRTATDFAAVQRETLEEALGLERAKAILGNRSE